MRENITNTWLGQPSANWTKNIGAHLVDERNVLGVDRKRYYWLVGQGGVIAQPPQAHMPPTNIPSLSFPTTGSPRFLQPAFYNRLLTTCFVQPASFTSCSLLFTLSIAKPNFKTTTNLTCIKYYPQNISSV